MKIKLQDVEMALQQAQLEPEKIQEIKDAILNISQTEEDIKDEISEKMKWEFVLAVSDDEGTCPDNLVGWVIQIPEGENPTIISETIARIANDFNITKKGRKLPVNNVGETIENVPAKFFKEHDIRVKNKVPAYVVPIKNKFVDFS